MTVKPTRAEPDGRAYLDLQNLARRTGRPTDELQQIYALEGFLDRLATSPYSDQLVLKGGVLLAAFGMRRPTRDVDLQGQALPNDLDAVLDLVRGIVAIERPDGLRFDPASASAETIREDDAYSGVRVSMEGRLATARLHFHADINVGDPVWPPPQRIGLPRLLGGEITLWGYPLAMIYAEKLATALDRGLANTRWRDFGDVYLLVRRHDIRAAEVGGAIERVAAFRAVELMPLAKALDGFGEQSQQRWVVWRRKQRLEDRLPDSFAQVIDTIAAFVDPVLTRAVDGRVWDSTIGQWRHEAD